MKGFKWTPTTVNSPSQCHLNFINLMLELPWSGTRRWKRCFTFELTSFLWIYQLFRVHSKENAGVVVVVVIVVPSVILCFEFNVSNRINLPACFIPDDELVCLRARLKPTLRLRASNLSLTWWVSFVNLNTAHNVEMCRCTTSTQWLYAQHTKSNSANALRNTRWRAQMNDY